MKAFKHFILTRFNQGIYDRPDAEAWMEDRMELFKATCESVLIQDVEFEWVIEIDSRTPQSVRDVITHDDDRIDLFDSRITNYFEWFNRPNEPWIITSRFDNDDIYLPGALRAIQSCFTAQEIVIDIPYYQKKGNDLYTSARPTPNSPFLSLIEKSDKEVIRTCYARPHNLMSQDWPVGIFASRDVLAYMVIHGNNLGNRIVGEKI